MKISDRDLVKLAILLSKTVHSLEFPEFGKSAGYINKTLSLVNHLQDKYPNAADQLSSIRNAVLNITENKLAFFKVTKELLSTVNRLERQRNPGRRFMDFIFESNTGAPAMQVAV